MDARRQSAWLEALELSRRMLTEAGAGDWQVVDEKEELRRKLLEMVFEESIAAEDSEDVACGIREMLDINEQIRQLGYDARQKVLSQNVELENARRAHAAYMKNI